jgi:membrane associated rhomboid family serine protease
MQRRAFPSGLRPPRATGVGVLASLVLICVLVEGVLTLADLGLIDAPRLRSRAYANGAFWPGLMRDWQPNYPIQPWAMYITHGFLHGGVVHLVLNMVTLWSLGAAVMERVSPARFLAIYFGAMLGGGAVYALLAISATPMVGASGALFGLAGAILAWMWEDQPSLRDALRLAGRAVLILLAINVALHFVLAGQLAWQTHLGGFLAGWILAIALDPLEAAR